jgi:hypothetical protein
MSFARLHGGVGQHPHAGSPQSGQRLRGHDGTPEVLTVISARARGVCSE